MGCGSSTAMVSPTTELQVPVATSVEGVKKWSPEQVSAWIGDLFKSLPDNGKKISGQFASGCVTGVMLIEFSDEDLQELVEITNKLQRRKIIKTLGDLKPSDNGSPEASPTPAGQGESMASVVPGSKNQQQSGNASSLMEAAKVLEQQPSQEQQVQSQAKTDGYSLPKSTPSKSIAPTQQRDWSQSAADEQRKKQDAKDKAQRDGILKEAQDKAALEAREAAEVRRLADAKRSDLAAVEAKRKTDEEAATREAQRKTDLEAAEAKRKQDEEAAEKQSKAEESAKAAATMPKRASVGFAAEPEKSSSLGGGKMSEEQRKKRQSKADWAEFARASTVRAGQLHGKLEKMKTTGAFWDEDEMKDQMAEEKKKTQGNDAIMRVLRVLWDRYDDDGNGELDRNECQELFAEYLENNKEGVKQMIKATIDAEMEKHMKDLVDVTAKQGAGLTEEEIQDLRDDMKAPMAKIQEIIQRKAMKFIEGILNDPEDLKEKSTELMESMDEDGNGLIDEEEFMGGFFESMTTVLDMTDFTARAADMMQSWDEYDDEYVEEESDDDE